MLNLAKFSRGDTLIEVLFAITVFSLVVVGSLSVMNSSSATAQRSLEITLVRQEIDAQAETLRFLNASYIAAYKGSSNDYDTNTPAGQWKLIQEYIVAANNSAVSDFGTDTAACPTAPSDSFILNAKAANFVDYTSGIFNGANTFSQLVYDTESQAIISAEGLWIEAVRSTVSDNNQDNSAYIDFHIRACWDSPGQSTPVTIGTIVRLYEPR